MKRHILLLFSILLIASFQSDAKKIKQTLRIDKEKKATGKKKHKTSSEHYGEEMPSGKGFGVRIDAETNDSVWLEQAPMSPFVVSGVSFAGYDKSINATKESIHIINNSGHHLKGVTLHISYLDMKGRMLHSREVTLKCDVPDKETRKLDFPTWDTQKSFYYHLGPEPRRVASPYDVEIRPMAFFI